MLMGFSLVEDESISGAAATSSGEPIVKILASRQLRENLQLKIIPDMRVANTDEINTKYEDILDSI